MSEEPPGSDEELPEQLRVRRAKLDRLRESGVDPYPVAVPRTASLAEVEARLLAAAPGAAEVLERLLDEVPDPADEILLDSLPISLYGGG